MSAAIPPTTTGCYHCGSACDNYLIEEQDKKFCCVGCYNVYHLLHQHDMDYYYCLNQNPGSTQKEIAAQKFTFLDDPTFAAHYVQFKNNEQTNVQFYIPQIHCSSCLWLLENLHTIHKDIIGSQVQFNHKTIHISFNHQNISLSEVAILLASLGYEPHLSADDETPNQPTSNKSNTIKLGIAGFSFANIMLISFPEYFGLSFAEDPNLASFFRYINLGLAIPVITYCAQDFFKSGYYSIKQKALNIDAPIALAILLTYVRSLYEIFSQTGPGYLDSMSGIIFFMLIGRTLQNKTISTLKFNRDYKSYFPLAVTRVKNGIASHIHVEQIAKDDILHLFNQEIIPVDCLLSKGNAVIDYSFVTGESLPETMYIGDIIYTGGRVAGNSIEVIALKPFSQNSFTKLWNNDTFKKNDTAVSYLDYINKYFSLAVLILGIAVFAYWQLYNPPNAWKAISTILIVACPCALLLASSYAHGYLIELFSSQGFFVKNARVIEELSKVEYIVFDKTGTLTESSQAKVSYFGKPLDEETKSIVLSILHQSTHSLAKAISAAHPNFTLSSINHYKEIAGKGIEAWVDDKHYKCGSASFVGLPVTNTQSGSVYISVDNHILGSFQISSKLRPGISSLIKRLKGYGMSLLSGDHEAAKSQMEHVFPSDAELRFEQNPEMKLKYISALQAGQYHVLMMGDGLNDAGALKQSDVGIAIVENNFNFSPACDVVCHANNVSHLDAYLGAAKTLKKIVFSTFVYSLLYNFIGLYFAVNAKLEPVIAAILMPASSISIILISYIGVLYIKKKYFDFNPQNKV